MKKISSTESGLWATGNEGSWNTVLLLCLLAILGETVSITLPYFTQISSPSLIKAHAVHLGGVIAIGLFLLFARKIWSTRIAMVLYLLIFLPWYPIIWKTQEALANSGKPWAPFIGFRLYLFCLGVLVPGPYWFNILLIVAVWVECIALWFHLDIAHQAHAIMGPEPWATFLYVIVAIGLVLFRARDERLIRRLSLSQARAESLENLARIFLTLRDRANTPLQTLEVSAELLKRQCPDAKELTAVMSGAISRLSATNKLLSQLDQHVAWGDKELMSDEDLLRLLKSASKRRHRQENVT